LAAKGLKTGRKSQTKDPKYPIRHGTGSRQWAGDVHKKWCQKHFDEYNKLGWLSSADEITIVPEEECECAECKYNKEKNSKKKMRVVRSAFGEHLVENDWEDQDWETYQFNIKQRESIQDRVVREHRKGFNKDERKFINELEEKNMTIRKKYGYDPVTSTYPKDR
jgi:hypothetical protein